METNQPLSLIDRVAYWVNLNPDKVAIYCNGHTLTYQQLHNDSSTLAFNITGLTIGSPFIGLSANKTAESIVGMLSIIKAGKAYLPLDRTYPVERILQMVEDSGITHIVCEPSDSSFFEQFGLICLSVADALATEITNKEQGLPGPGELVALLYTSGSTGVPKGVCLTHTGMRNIVEHQLLHSIADSNAHILLFSHLSFDVSFQDIFTSLTAGGTLHIIDDTIRLDTIQLLQYLDQNAINMADLPYVTFQHLCEAAEQLNRYPSALKEVTSGGELIKITPAIRNFFRKKPDSTLVIAYGPTECSVSVTDLRLHGDPDAWPNIPSIGRPVTNVNIRLLDTEKREVPMGEIGEIHIGGISLARGYLNREELTAERFIHWTAPSGEQERLYCTGDLGLLLPSGEFVFHGRTDNQVKIRGNRVELGEIEACLAELPSVSQNVVVMREDVPGLKRLVSYMIATDESLKDVAALRTHLEKKLPNYMMPDIFVWVDSFPKTTSGKVDRKALPVPEATRPDMGVAYRAPGTEHEKFISSLWSSLLLIDQVGIDDNFFELGGNSLLAMRAMLSIEKERSIRLPLTTLFRNPIVHEFASYLDQYVKEHPIITDDSNKESLEEPVSIAIQKDADGITWVPTIDPQREIWMASAVGGDEHNISYNLSVSLRFHGAFDVQSLNDAFKDLVERHEALRTKFNHDGSLVGILEQYEETITAEDLIALSEDDQNKLITDSIHKIVNTPFDLQQVPLFRVSLFKLKEDYHYFTLVVHHIIADGWSLNILLNELILLYNNYASGKKTALPQAASLREYLINQHAFYQGPAYKRMETFWLAQYQDSLPVLNLPTDFPRTNKRHLKRSTLTLPIDPALFEKFKRAFANIGGSVAIGARAVLEILISKLTQQNDIVIGMPVAGHMSIQNQSLVAQCVNTLPLRARIDETLTFQEYLSNRRQSVLEAYENDKISFVSLSRQLKMRRNNTEASFVPIFFDCFDWDNKVSDSTEGAHPGLSYEIIENTAEYSGFDFFINVACSSDTPVLQWSYNTHLFKESSVQQMMEQFTSLLNTVVAEPTARLMDITFKDDNAAVGNAQHATAMEYPRDKPLTAYITEITQANPDKTAILFNGNATSYRELEERSNQLANYLISKGVTTGNIIGVAMDRSIDMVIALLGVVKAGAAYIPLDPQYPVNRVEFMLQDSAAKFLLTESKYSRLFNSEAEELLYDELAAGLAAYKAEAPQVSIQGDNLVYILYTSGSTGKPKGVQIKHYNLANFLLSMQREPGMTADDVLLALTTISFDIAGLELFLPLISGATMILADSDTRLDSQRILDITKSQGVTLLQATPATWRMMLESGWNDRLAIKALCGGEAFPTDLAEKLLRLCDEVWNVYGPTETTIWSTLKRVKPDELPITVGKPIHNTQVYILDETLAPVKTGQEGEIYIGGDGVAQGYLNRPELTAERFLPDPFSPSPNASIYRTGDLGKILPNGEIQCLGRIDTQVKIRGFRIELGEIEYHLNKQENIKESVVVAREDRPGDQRLVAYILLNDNEIVKQLPESGIAADRESTKQWKQGLLSVLPPYMVPNDWVLLPAFPLTPNKKIDRKALPKPSAPIDNAEDDITETELTPNEKKVFDIWASIFKTTDIRKDDDFFELGGHSLLAVEVMARIEKEIGIKLPLASLFEHATIERLAALLDNDTKIKWDCLVPIKPQGSKNPLYIVHGAGLNVLLFSSLTEHLDKDQPIYGLQAKGLNGEDEPFTSIPEMAAHYISEILSQNPDGPYALSGFSFGGIIAYEMARQLLEMGKEVRMLAMFDTFSHETDKYLPWYTKYPKRFSFFIMKVLHSIYLMAKDPKDNIRYKYTSVKRMIIQWYWKITGKSDDVVGFFGYMNKVDKINDQALDDYVLEPIDLDIHVFRATVHRFYAKDFKYLGWKKFAKKGVKIYNIPGEHNLIFAPPNDKDFGRILQKVLDET